MNIPKFITVIAVLSAHLASCFENKGSFTFVIDNTASMADDISHIKEGIDAIFETVKNLDEWPIENFVLVTFNDSSAEVRADTKDLEVFKNALSSITFADGDDCPENVMTGIKLALEKSRPFSIIIVFTDASAKDYRLYDEVHDVAIQRRSVIDFVITGSCGSERSADYRVYQRLAKATVAGQVYAVQKNEIKDVLSTEKYNIAEYNIKLIAINGFRSGYGHKVNFSTDAKPVWISVTGKALTVDITAPDGTKPTIDLLMDTDRVKILKLSDPKPGNYTLEVGSSNFKTYVLVYTH